MIKLVATDMDGTLLNSKKEKPEGLYDWINNHRDIKFVIASGRQYYTLKSDFLPVHNDLIYIADNGALVFEKDQIIYINKMTKDDVLLSLDLLSHNPDACPIVCGVKSAYMYKRDEDVKDNTAVYYERLIFVDDLKSTVYEDEVVKIAIYFRNKDASIYTKDFDVLPEHLSSVLSSPQWIDIANAGVNKGDALREIQTKYNIRPDESMAFGDYLNDWELLEAVEESYCMENGLPEMKKIAKHIAPSNDDDGVMKILNTL